MLADPSVQIATNHPVVGDMTSADIDLGNGLATYIFSLRTEVFNVYDVAANQLYQFNSLQMADGTSVTSQLWCWLHRYGCHRNINILVRK